VAQRLRIRGVGVTVRVDERRIIGRDARPQDRSPPDDEETLMPAELTDPVVAAFVAAVNAGDNAAFFALLTDDATMSDDGTERNLRTWVDREIFTSAGRMDVESASDDGRSLIANYANATWGAMRTRWTFTVTGDRISRFETGQA
jgi:hypothetical protein